MGWIRKGSTDRYRHHATLEKFHSEFKTHPDLEGPPSGKFDTSTQVTMVTSLAQGGPGLGITILATRKALYVEAHRNHSRR